MVNDGIKIIFDNIWKMFNIGIPINGFNLKLWYLPAFGILINVIFKLFGMSTIGFSSGCKEKSGSSANYRSKKGRGKDNESS